VLTNENAPDENVHQLITEEIQSLLLDLDDDEAEVTVTPDQTLHAIGLNSLMLAQLLVTLEADLGVDPFGDDLSIADMRTVQDLISAYERAVRSAVVT
jgi:acyl carrier protein